MKPAQPKKSVNPKAQILAAKKKAAEDLKKRFIQHCVKNGLPEPEAEYKFHPERKWRIDYIFKQFTWGKHLLSKYAVALEVEGGTWGKKSRHTTGTGFIADMEKYNEIAIAGIRLIRVIPKDLFSAKTITLIKRALYD